MYTLLRLFSFLTLSSLAQVQALANSTVHAWDTGFTPMAITYEGGAGVSRNISACRSGENRADCWPIREPPCTTFTSHGQQNTSLARWKFTGISLRITSLIGDTSPVYDVKLDGNSTEVDGALMARHQDYTCYVLYSIDGLEDIEHTVVLSVKGPSPNRNTSADGPNGEPNMGQFSIVNYTVELEPNRNRDGNSGSSHLPVSGMLLVLIALAVCLGLD
ncbi:hypothetical protein PM082_015971 [Marasmius tenuissimus]|nr:hypothetical protein PM082_015971 [Marasmius tenuissimus]